MKTSPSTLPVCNNFLLLQFLLCELKTAYQAKCGYEFDSKWNEISNTTESTYFSATLK